jgi:hypothetical protein
MFGWLCIQLFCFSALHRLSPVFVSRQNFGENVLIFWVFNEERSGLDKDFNPLSRLVT